MHKFASQALRLKPLRFRSKLNNISIRSLSVGKIPDSFYDEESELEKEQFDFKLAKITGGVQNLTTGYSHGKMTIDDVQAHIEIAANAEESTDDKKSRLSKQDDNSDHIEFVPPAYENHPLRQLEPDEEEDDPEDLPSFVKLTDKRSQPADAQGLVDCPGKRQRSGKFPKLKCHLIDLEALHYTDVVMMKRFLAEDSEIMGRRSTGLCSKCQRKVAQAVKRARNLGLLTHLGAYRVVDADPVHDQFQYNFHRRAAGVEPVISKTILK